MLNTNYTTTAGDFFFAMATRKMDPMFFIYESPAPMKGEVFMKNERELDESREVSVEEVYAEYVKKDIE